MSPQPAFSNIPGARKAAVLLMGLGNQASADVIRLLEPEEIRRLTNEISALETVEPEQLMSVFLEFEEVSATSKYMLRGGADHARRMIEQAMGKETMEQLLDGPVPINEPHHVSGSSPFEGTDPKDLAKVLREENPQTLALILANLPPDQAGPLMASLPEEIQPQVALRIALMDRLSPEVFNRIAQAIRGRLKASRQLTRSNGDRTLAAILNNIDGEVADRLLTTIEPENEAAVASVRQLMFVFEDVIEIDKEGIKVILARVDRKILTLALKGTNEKIKQHFSQCMSQRSAEMLFEDMEALGPVRIREVQAAQQQIVGTIRQLEKEGAIASARGGGDEYVV